MREPAPFDTTSHSSDGFGDDTADLPAEGRKIGGRYRSVRTLGSGGMGSVHEVVSDDGRRLALKLLEDGSARERFFREAKAAQAIENEHVVRTLELGVDEALGRPFIVMELLEGRDLARTLASSAPLAPEVVARIGLQAARGLAAAHAAGIVHRDVKPSNVFLHREAERIVVKLCDFGIAKRVSEIGAERASLELTRTGGFLGSPRYMSPEQAKSARNVDARSDVWSLCVTLYEALTGTELWSGHTSLGEVIVAICTEPIPPLSKAAPWASPALARIIERGLSREPERRFASMDALAAELERCVGDRTQILAEDLVRFVPAEAQKSRRTLAIAAAVVAAALAIATAIWSMRAPVSELPAAESAPPIPVEPAAAEPRAPEPATGPTASVAPPRSAALPPRKSATARTRTPEPASTAARAQPSATGSLPAPSAPSAPSIVTPKEDW